MRNIRLCAFADEADKSFEGQILALKRNNIDLIEIRGIDGINVADADEELILKAKKMLDDNGIKVWSVGSPIGKCNINDDFSVEFARFQKILKYAELLGAENIRMFSFYGTNGDKAYSKEVISRLEKFVEEAKKYNVTLCHENEKDIYGEKINECVELYKALPEIKAVYDPANFVQCGEEAVPAWNAVKSYVKYCHIKDADKDGKNVMAGLGIGHIPEIIDDFSKDGREVVLSIEPHLFAFIGLKALENGNSTDEHVGSMKFDNGNDAFDADVKAIRKIINGLDK